MKKQIIGMLCISFTVFSCGEKEETPTGELNAEQIESLNMDAKINFEEIKYEGVYEGTIKGKEIKLTLKSESFDFAENGKKASGDWSVVDDGTIIELEPKSGTVSTRFFGYSDENTWVALSDSMTYVEPEEYLNRTMK
ncbi:MAG TPA: hypothetical protein VL022_05130 [Moheibacter sp.]|nr:hypothetical protein [Moheibacter sp.]